jgi:FKBP-type peptidyl-prolyl cis-trans isomerase 2
MRKKYHNITFYCHNLAGYDIVFILKVLSIYNDNNKDEYNISSVLRNNKIIKATISKGANTLTLHVEE